LYSRASKDIDLLCADFGQNNVRWMMILMQRTWRIMFDQLIINQDTFSQIKKLINDKDTSVVYLPNHRSHTDYLLMTYLHFFYSL
jgi:glycerol-3-phosphate O-acyltransferase